MRGMVRLARVLASFFLSASLVVCARAIDSAGSLYRNSRSSVDSGGTRKTSTNFRGDASAGTVTAPSGTAASFLNRDGFMGIAYQPARITDLWASSTTQTTERYIQWTAPGNDGSENTTAGAFIIKYSSVAGESPALSDAKFNAANSVASPPAPSIRGTLQALTVTGLMSGVTYYFAIKTSERDGLRAVLSSGATAWLDIIVVERLAQTPYGIEMSTAGGNVTLRWLPVVRFADLAPFASANAPASSELTAYHVCRSSTIISATWTELAVLSTGTFSWTGAAVSTAPYYAVRSANNTVALSASVRSLIRSADTLEGFLVAPDEQSYYRIPASQIAPLVGVAGDPASAYAIVISSRPQDLGDRVYKSLDFAPYRGGITSDPDFHLEGLGTLYLHYAVSGSSLAPSFFGAAAVPQNASAYWWNGVRWLQLYGKLQSSFQNIFLETKYFGRYQIRSVERVTKFSFNLAGVSNRFATPNGDGKNDSVVFTFDNPNDAIVRGRILDMRGRVIVANLTPGPTQNSMQWDGTAGGRGVPGGIYIYQLEGEGQSFSGTLVVLK